ncbi:uncharacterized protein LOC119780432 [Cyprinodon tularosa]|uniref:uncharacterized protein LOC119780432 n=1 Tax=Cyprinodon tularosa TaxID=77115 RepID=UPI0018E217CF|nr:uncharacterized protein LOC119780432 [Cyprinodon tularosa]
MGPYGFSYSPLGKKKYGPQTEDFTKRRRAAWVAAVRRKDITFHKISPHARVCSRHFQKGQPAYEMMKTDPDWAPSLHLGHTDIRPTDTERSLRRGYREQLKKNALQATETGLHRADEILEQQDEVTHEATENPNQQQTDTQKAAENVGRPNTKDDTEGGRQEGQTECNLCVLRCAEMNHLLEENRELRRELDELRISDCFFGDTNEKVQYYTGLPNLAQHCKHVTGGGSSTIFDLADNKLIEAGASMTDDGRMSM